MAIRITHVRLSGGTGHEHITRLWWVNPVSGKTDDNTRATIVSWIEDKDGEAFVQEPGTVRAEVGVVTPSQGAKHLRTYADGKYNNNLLSLPRK